jgi:plastocyanin
MVGATIVLTASMMPTAQAQGTTWNVGMGAQSKDYARQALAFLPNEIWIYEGDSIKWTAKSDEVHTVTFLKQANGGAPTAGTTRPATGAGCTGGKSGRGNSRHVESFVVQWQCVREQQHLRGRCNFHRLIPARW